MIIKLSLFVGTLYTWFSFWFVAGVSLVILVHTTHIWFSFSSYTGMQIAYT